MSPCKSDDSESGYSSTNSFNENPKVEALFSELNKAFMEKKCVSRESDNFKILRSRINRNLFVYVQYTYYGIKRPGCGRGGYFPMNILYKTE